MHEILTMIIGTHRGSNKLSLWLRKRIEKIPLFQVIGVHLAGVAFFSAVIMPQADDIFSQIEMLQNSKAPMIDIIASTGAFQWPLSRFALSQRFASYHSALDLSTDFGTPIHPINDGWVAWTNSMPVGYGNHVLVQHDNGIASLYAHLSKTLVKPGQTVTKETVIGDVGATGWATGNHLHLEVYDNGSTINPLEVLPALPQAKNQISL